MASKITKINDIFFTLFFVPPPLHELKQDIDVFGFYANQTDDSQFAIEVQNQILDLQDSVETVTSSVGDNVQRSLKEHKL